MVAVRVVEMTRDDVVEMVFVFDGLVAARRSVSVIGVVAGAGMTIGVAARGGMNVIHVP